MPKSNVNNVLGKIPFKVNPYITTVVILILVIIIILSGRQSFEDTYDAYIEATMAGNAQAVVDLLHNSYIEQLIKAGEIESEYDLVQRVQSKLDWYLSRAELHRGENGEYFEYVAELQDVKDEEMDGALPIKLEYICGDSLGNLKAAKKVYITYMCYYYSSVWEENTVQQITYDYYIYFVKIGNSWYLGEIDDYSNYDW